MIWSMPCGAYTLFAIEDGWFFRDPEEQFPDSRREDWPADELVEGRLRISMGCFLLMGGELNVMIDSGIGNLAGTLAGNAVGGQLPQALALIGIRPEEVDDVIHTHLHLDHVGGDRAPSGKPFFPRARIHVHSRELEFWSSTDEHPAAGAVRDIVEGFVEEDRIEPFDGEAELVPGVTVVETPGHTPGHVSLAIVSQGSRTFITGDVTHHPRQLQHPEWNVGADLDAAAARASRERVFERVAGSGTLVGAGHYPGPGLGYVEVDDRQRVFVGATSMQVA